MRTAPLLLALLACLALIPGAVYADEKRDQSNQQLLLKPAQSGHKGLAEANPHKQLQKRPAHRPPARVMNPRRGSSGSSSTARSQVIQNPIAGRSRPVRPQVAARTPTPLLSSVRHHSPNSAVISGSTNLSTRNTGSIDGRHVHRRP